MDQGMAVFWSKTEILGQFCVFFLKRQLMTNKWFLIRCWFCSHSDLINAHFAGLHRKLSRVSMPFGHRTPRFAWLMLWNLPELKVRASLKLLWCFALKFFVINFRVEDSLIFMCAAHGKKYGSFPLTKWHLRCRKACLRRNYWAAHGWFRSNNGNNT